MKPLTRLLLRAVKNYTKKDYDTDACAGDQDTLIEKFPEHAEKIVAFFTHLFHVAEGEYDLSTLVAETPIQRQELKAMANDIRKARENVMKEAIELLRVLDFSEYMEYCFVNNIPVEYL